MSDSRLHRTFAQQLEIAAGTLSDEGFEALSGHALNISQWHSTKADCLESAERNAAAERSTQEKPE